VNKLDGVETEALREALVDVTSAKATKRLMIALAYADGTSVERLTERYGIARSTVYYWLDRFEERSIEDAIEDEDRPGRPPALSATQREELAAALAGQPSDCGYDGNEWTPPIVRRHIERTYGVTYSLGHVRYLLRKQFAREREK
jgi:transposase